MDARRRLASLVLESGWTISGAARVLGVSRQTAHEWVRRARCEGIVQMSERSRRPLRSPGRTPEEVQRLVLGAAAEYPAWGPKTLHALLWPPGEAPVCERTVARILARAGRRCLPERLVDPAPHRFEREAPNELWQADFKRIGPRKERREALSVLDDATRFCIALAGVEDQTLGTVWETLWEAFGQFGLPEQILTDNGPAFRSNATWRWSSFDLRLMLLGIRPLHGRPYHPQTQGKVERFHGTLEREVRFEGSSEEELSRFRDRYNWVRPHHALAMRTPGSVYVPSARVRPARMPEPFFPAGAELRRCDDSGVLTYRGCRYKLGRAMARLPIGILVMDEVARFAWGDFVLADLKDMRV